MSARKRKVLFVQESRARRPYPAKDDFYDSGDESSYGRSGDHDSRLAPPPLAIEPHAGADRDEDHHDWGTDPRYGIRELVYDGVLVRHDPRSHRIVELRRRVRSHVLTQIREHTDCDGRYENDERPEGDQLAEPIAEAARRDRMGRGSHFMPSTLLCGHVDRRPEFSHCSLLQSCTRFVRIPASAPQREKTESPAPRRPRKAICHVHRPHHH